MVIDSSRKALIVAGAAQDKHAEDLLILDLRQISSVADFFVICTAASRPQANAIVEAVEQALHRQHQRAGRAEGLHVHEARSRRRLGRAPRAGASEEGRLPQFSSEQFSWVVMDCESVVLHLFDPATRVFYQLERLWGDAPRLPLLDVPASVPVPSGRPER
ncbi:MAG: RsfS/YbeB/iojap family protein [Candidatus Omnitrophica bacterium]|nr:RsfS/YbeB/iojap family protein [Candidatus Omnitrophota bacterium]